jgi:uncharacterized protein (DUF1697 family)
MALVVLLRGVNVGGHRTFRPADLARQLAHLEVVNIGAAGTFVVRRPVTIARLRAELAERLPFETQMMICDGREVAHVMARHPYADQPARPDIVRFVSVLPRRQRKAPPLPIQLPATGKWLLQLLAVDGRYAFGAYRRDMKVVGYLGRIDQLLGVPVTTRNWNTMAAIAKTLNEIPSTA